MFDIGFAELIIIAVVGLLVIGPERLPGTIRTANLWLNRIKRGFNDIKQEVQQELHDDSVMQELRKTGEQLKKQAEALKEEAKARAEEVASQVKTKSDELTQKGQVVLEEQKTKIQEAIESGKKITSRKQTKTEKPADQAETDKEESGENEEEKES